MISTPLTTPIHSMLMSEHAKAGRGVSLPKELRDQVELGGRLVWSTLVGHPGRWQIDYYPPEEGEK